MKPTCPNGEAVRARIRAGIARVLASTRAVNQYCIHMHTFQRVMTCRAVLRFPDRFEQAVRGNTDWLVRSLIGRATDNAHVSIQIQHVADIFFTVEANDRNIHLNWTGSIHIHQPDGTRVKVCCVIMSIVCVQCTTYKSM